jgi:hypothetical protein
MRLSGTRAAAISQGSGLGDVLWDLAGELPSLDQRFAESRSLIDAVSGQQLITFTRASDGTFVGSNGLIQTAGTNVPRFTHDPVTLESLGLLVEEQRANLLLRSEELETTWGSNNYTITSNLTAAPDGANTADKLIRNTLDATAPVSQNVTVSASTAYTLSLYAKAAEWGKIGLREGSTTGNYVTFDLATASVVSTQIATGSIASVGNGWFRLTMTMTTSGGQSSYGVRVIPLPPSYTSGTPNYSFAGDGTSGLFIWGAQLEAGASATSYIPTTTATVTRSADVVSITGSAFSSWYRQDEGTVFAHFNSTTWNADPNFPKPFVAGTDDNNSFWIGGTTDDNQYRYRVRTGAVNQFGAANITRTPTISNKVAMAVKAADFAVAADGGNLATGSSGTMPASNQIYIGQDLAATNYINQPIRRLTYWPQRLSNTTLQALTQ